MKHQLIILASCLLFSSLGQAQNAEAPPAPTIESKLERQGPVEYLKVTDLRAVQRNNLLNVQVEITNLAAFNQQLYYRFKWLDRDGFTTGEEEPWKPLIVYCSQKQTINTVAPSFKAADFRLILQSPGGAK